MKIVRNSNFVSEFSFSDHDNLYFYTYNDNGRDKHFKCFLNYGDLNITMEFCQIEFDYSKVIFIYRLYLTHFSDI